MWLSFSSWHLAVCAGTSGGRVSRRSLDLDLGPDLDLGLDPGRLDLDPDRLDLDPDHPGLDLDRLGLGHPDRHQGYQQ